MTDKKYEKSILRQGLMRHGPLHFMYENGGSPGYISKRAGTRERGRYPTTFFLRAKCSKLDSYGYDLFLTANGVALVFDDVDLQYIKIVEEYPYLGLNVFSRSVGHSLPREVHELV